MGEDGFTLEQLQLDAPRARAPMLSAWNGFYASYRYSIGSHVPSTYVAPDGQSADSGYCHSF